MRARRFMTPCKNAQDENEPPLDVSLNSVGRESFGCISPISKSVTPQSRPKSLPSSRKKEDSESSLFRSTPDRSLIGRCKSFDTSTDNAVNCSHLSSKRKSFQMSDDRSSESNDTVNFSYDDEMQSSYGSQQHPQTPTMNKSKRRCSSVNRKNLSRSFNQIEEHQALSLDRTDSGFNDMNLDASAQNQMKFEQSFHFHDLMKCNNLADKSADISMASINWTAHLFSSFSSNFNWLSLSLSFSKKKHTYLHGHPENRQRLFEQLVISLFEIPLENCKVSQITANVFVKWYRKLLFSFIVNLFLIFAANRDCIKFYRL